MTEPAWREETGYPGRVWAVTRWKLRQEINGKEIDVDDEWGEEYGGSPDAVRKGIKEIILESNDDPTCSDLLLADLEALIKSEE